MIAAVVKEFHETQFHSGENIRHVPFMGANHLRRVKADFMQWFLLTRKREDPFCEFCGEESASHWHLHHKRYEDGKEPWEYSFEDIRMLCPVCHKEMHEFEKMLRAWIIGMSSNAFYEFSNLVYYLKKSFKPKDLASAACVARQELYDFEQRLWCQERREAGIHTPIESVADRVKKLFPPKASLKYWTRRFGSSRPRRESCG